MLVNYLGSFPYCFGSYLLDRGTDQQYHFHQKNVGRDIDRAVVDIYH